MTVKTVWCAPVITKMQTEETDYIVSANVAMMQPIPCNAASIHKQLAEGRNISAVDINSVCMSFVTALDMISYLIATGCYWNALTVSSDITSEGPNEVQQESYELFSDGATALIISHTENEKQGVMDSIIRAYSEGAYSTEIRGDGALHSATKYHTEDRMDYCFNTKGKSISSPGAKKLPEFFREFEEESGTSYSEVDIIVPHQASKTLPFIMSRLDIPVEEYMDQVG